MLNVIYIAGHARCGSTALEEWVNNTQTATGLGEVRDVFRFAELGHECSCGRPISGCFWWKPVIAEALKISDMTASEAADLTDSVENVAGYLDKSTEAKYLILWLSLIHI